LPDYDAKEVEAKLKARLDEIDRVLNRITIRGDEEDSELADYDQHYGDQGTEVFEQELDETRVATLRQERDLVEQAQQRLAEGKYGICVDCGRDIEPDRLRVMPEAIRCIRDQRLFEAGHSGETLPQDIP
jgi:RNA polymerase-binding transcription factor DksA